MNNPEIFFVSMNTQTGKVEAGKCAAVEYSVLGNGGDMLYEVKPKRKARFIASLSSLLTMARYARGIWYGFGNSPLDAKQKVASELARIRDEKKREYDRSSLLCNELDIFELPAKNSVK